MIGSPCTRLMWRAAHAVALGLLVSASAFAQGHAAAAGHPSTANPHAAQPAQKPAKPAAEPAEAHKLAAKPAEAHKPAAKPAAAVTLEKKKETAADREAEKVAAFMELQAAVLQIRQRIGAGGASAAKPPSSGAASPVVRIGEGAASAPKPHASAAASPRVRLVWRSAVIWPSELLESSPPPSRITLKWSGSALGR